MSLIHNHLTLTRHLQYYKQSLNLAGEHINIHKQSKRLADVVGKEYEEHRKRVWTHLGFTVDKKRNGAAFDVDWSIYDNGILVAIEEDKGHYVDSCFLERCIHSLIKTIHTMEHLESPLLILNSFTKYNLYEKKLVESLDAYKEPLVETFKDKFVYSYLNEFDRIKKTSWFKSANDNTDNPYKVYQNDTLIIKDIQLMLSLKK